MFLLKSSFQDTLWLEQKSTAIALNPLVSKSTYSIDCQLLTLFLFYKQKIKMGLNPSTVRVQGALQNLFLFTAVSRALFSKPTASSSSFTKLSKIKFWKTNLKNKRQCHSSLRNRVFEVFECKNNYVFQQLKTSKLSHNGISSVLSR